MTKRCGSFEIVNNKKPKLDDLWDDDLDSETIEDCFKLATQICEEDNMVCTQRNNVTILPTYNAFKNPKKIFTSTQCFVEIAPTSKQQQKQNFECKIRELEEKYEEKEGEVTILRTNLKELKHTQFIENERKQNEWKDKLSCKIKEMEEIRSELEFKNLEIANLKQTIKEVSRKLAKQSIDSPQKNQQIVAKNADFYDNTLNSFRLSIVSKFDYPLKNLDLSEVFQNSKNTNCLYSEILFLTNLEFSEFNQNRAIERINRIISIFKTTLREFHDIIKNPKNEVNNCGNDSGKILYFLSELLLFSNYTYDSLHNDINEISEILVILQRNKLGKFCVGFLSSFCRFLKNSIIKNNSNLFSITKTVNLLLCTINFDNIEVVISLCELFEIASNSPIFAENLCKNSKEITDCNFTKFGNLLDTFLNSYKLNELPKELCNSFLNFAFNLFKTNPKWTYLPENYCSNCISLLCKLSICLIYKSIERYKLGKIIEINFVDAVKILNLLSFSCYDVFEKCLNTFSQYKQIMYNLSNLQHDLQLTDYIGDLEQLTIIEEFPNIPADKFEYIDL